MQSFSVKILYESVMQIDIDNPTEWNLRHSYSDCEIDHFIIYTMN